MKNKAEVRHCSACKAFEDMRKEGFIEGEIKGKEEGREERRAEEIIETGQEFKLSEEEILQRLQNKLGISLDKADTSNDIENLIVQQKRKAVACGRFFVLR